MLALHTYTAHTRQRLKYPRFEFFYFCTFENNDVTFDRLGLSARILGGIYLTFHAGMQRTYRVAPKWNASVEQWERLAAAVESYFTLPSLHRSYPSRFSLFRDKDNANTDSASSRAQYEITNRQTSSLDHGVVISLAKPNVGVINQPCTRIDCRNPVESVVRGLSYPLAIPSLFFKETTWTIATVPR